MLIKTALSVLLCMVLCYSDAQAISRMELRHHYIQSLQRRSALDSFIAMLDKIKSPSPAEESYLGICHGMLIQYTEGNWSKYKLLMKSKGMLNSAIDRAPKDPELRFMRFTLEHYIPTFLCMSMHLHDDLNTMIAEPQFMDDSPDLKKMAVEFILDTKRCDDGQKKVLERALSELKKKLDTASKI